MYLCIRKCVRDSVIIYIIKPILFVRRKLYWFPFVIHNIVVEISPKTDSCIYSSFNSRKSTISMPISLCTITFSSGYNTIVVDLLFPMKLHYFHNIPCGILVSQREIPYGNMCIHRVPRPFLSGLILFGFITTGLLTRQSFFTAFW